MKANNVLRIILIILVVVFVVCPLLLLFVTTSDEGRRAMFRLGQAILPIAVVITIAIAFIVSRMRKPK